MLDLIVLLCCPDIVLNAQIDWCDAVSLIGHMVVNHGGGELVGVDTLTRRWWNRNGTAESPLACRNLITHFLRDN